MTVQKYKKMSTDSLTKNPIIFFRILNCFSIVCRIALERCRARCAMNTIIEGTRFTTACVSSGNLL